MVRRLTALILIAIVCICPLICYALTGSNNYLYASKPNTGEYVDGVYVPYDPGNADANDVEIFDQDDLDTLEENVDFPEAMAARTLMAIPNAIIQLLKLEDLVPLVYGKTPPKYYRLEHTNDNAAQNEPVEDPDWIPPENKIYGIWTPKEAALILSATQTVKNLLPVALVAALGVIGFMMLWGSNSSQNAEMVKSLGQGLLVMIVLIKFTKVIWGLLFGINNFFVDLAWKMLSDNERAVNFLSMLWRPGTKSLGMAIVATLVSFMIATMNFQYMVRKIMLGFLFIMTVFVAYASLFQSRKEALTIWKGETIGNIFLQSTHAFALTMFVKWLTVNPSFWTAMAFLLSMNSISVVIRNTMGLSRFDGRSVPSMAGNMLGLGALMAVPRLIGAVSGRKHAKAGTTLSGVAESATETGGKAVSAAASVTAKSVQAATGTGVGSPLANWARRTAVKAPGIIGASVLGTGGMFAGGMAFAAAGQSSAAGMMIGGVGGSVTGSKVGQSAGRTAAHTVPLIADMYKSHKMGSSTSIGDYLNEKSGFYDNSQLSDVNQMIDIGGNKASILFGEGAREAGQIYGEIKGRYKNRAGKRAKEISTNQINDAVKDGRKYDYDNSTFKSAVDHEVNTRNTSYLSRKHEQVANYKVKLDDAAKEEEIAKVRLQMVEAENGKYTPEYQVEYENFESAKAKLSETASVYGRRSPEYKEAYAQYESVKTRLDDIEATHGKYNSKYQGALEQHQKAVETRVKKELQYKVSSKQYEKQITTEATVKRLNRYRRDITKKAMSENGFDGSWATM